MRTLILLITFSWLASTSLCAQIDKEEEVEASENGFQAYEEIVSEKAQTDEGLFKVHKVGDTYYYEIPHVLLGREMLWVSRIVSLPPGFGNGYINAGSKTNEMVVSWERHQDKILLKMRTYGSVAPDSLPIYQSVKANNFEPTLYAFDIKAFSADSTSVVIDVTKTFSSDVQFMSGLSASQRKSYKVKSLDASRSFINSVKSFPENIEVRQEMTFEASEPPSNVKGGAISLQMNQSMILLSEEPMQPRIFDPRVGWFTIGQIDFSSQELKADSKQYIKRWNLVPKDKEAYARGELVEPIKPIVYYIDPATPKKLRPYIKQGIEDWQKPFESAGFKNAIIAKDPPSVEEDPDFSPEDVRYSVVRYVASTTRNAVGPSVSDPRSGEIIESDIIWYHNHLRSYRNRYLLETGAANPSARSLNTPEEEIGEMMRMVIAHEVGHALGFPHNMKASFAYPVDSLRSATFTQKYGIAASIMDYARYNYVAQPGDEGVRFIRQMGPYDHYAVNWGYRFLDKKKPEDEVPILNSWVMEKDQDPIFEFGRQRNSFDPSSQTECVGNDPIKASQYGIQNLKIVANNLPEWTSDISLNYDDLEELTLELLGVYSRYIGHVASNIGGVYETIKTPEQEGFVYEAVSASSQRASLQWLLDNAFESPDWLIKEDILRNIGHSGYFEAIRKLQVRQLNSLLSFGTLGRLIDAESVYSDFYPAQEMMASLREGIWSELKNAREVDLFRRNLQKSYLDRMEYLMKEEMDGNGRVFSTNISYKVSTSDVRSLVLGELRTLRAELEKAMRKARNKETSYHYQYALMHIDRLLEVTRQD